MELFAFWAIFSVVIGVGANARGRSALGWFLLALLISPLLALILLLVLPSVGDEPRQSTPPTSSFAPTLRVPPGGLPSWTRPDPNGPTTRLEGGLELAVAHRVDDWAQVRASNGWEGWVDARRLVPFAAPPDPTPELDELEDRLAKATGNWTVPSVVRAYALDDDGAEDMADETLLFELHGYERDDGATSGHSVTFKRVD
jgi:hypothetical protein